MIKQQMKLLIPILALITLIRSQRVIPVQDMNNIKLSFGSCNEFHGGEQADIFYHIGQAKPDVWVWLGDVLYLDMEYFPPFYSYVGKEKVSQMFQTLKDRPEYKYLMNKTEIVGVWDDHDFGIENGDKHFEHKEEMMELWLDFIGEPKNSPRRTQQGIYDSYFLGSTEKVHIILLDVRFQRDDLYTAQDMLGEEQWVWFEKELKNSPSKYIVIGSGSQFLPDDRFLPENWYEPSRSRLFELIRRYRKSGVFIISGDVHYAEIMKYPCREDAGYTIYEFTSSGLTHHSGSHIPIFSGYAKYLYPPTYNMPDDRYAERNFGLMTFNFEGENQGVNMQAFNYYGIKVLEKFVSYDEVQFNEENLKADTCYVKEVHPIIRAALHFIFELVQLRYEAVFMAIFVPYLCVIGYHGVKLIKQLTSSACRKKPHFRFSRLRKFAKLRRQKFAKWKSYVSMHKKLLWRQQLY